jgi:hypothetical protein
VLKHLLCQRIALRRAAFGGSPMHAGRCRETPAKDAAKLPDSHAKSGLIQALECPGRQAANLSQRLPPDWTQRGACHRVVRLAATVHS